ncbi:MAG TPA: tRNA (N6-isopentenyl adenosine(37)-C2)-methylthiotransferase MiaB [Candidatus Atribacteria bacterium]|nr:tRNA (N6-isopentenyl adenosine(37)-C2)-methylthiotransferase MiaB [Candidatus Atribacteria bacterium]
MNSKVNDKRKPGFLAPEVALATFGVRTFGCQMNKSRSEHLAYRLRELGFSQAEKLENADVVIFNTCAVREHAAQRAMGIIGQFAREHKERNPRSLLVVCGCLGQLQREKLLEKCKEIDVLAGTHNWEDLPFLIQRAWWEKEKIVAFRETPPSLYEEKGYWHSNRISAYLPITFGCDNFCSYCVVPYTTGRQRSKPVEIIEEEVKNLADNGFREITLLGQNVNSYGRDWGREEAFEDLLSDIEKWLRGKKIWLRFLTSHPRDLRRGIVEVVKYSDCICPYFHLPLQAGSNKILHLMNRGYTRENYLDKVNLIRQSISGARVGTDIIVGFPGETDSDFQETLEVVKEAQFDVAYTYIYSPRPGTGASLLKDDIPLEVKKERLHILNDILRGIYQKKLPRLEGKIVEVLIDQKEGDLVSGRTANNLRVYLREAHALEIGEWVEVLLTPGEENKVYGSVER